MILVHVRVHLQWPTRHTLPRHPLALVQLHAADLLAEGLRQGARLALIQQHLR